MWNKLLMIVVLAGGMIAAPPPPDKTEPAVQSEEKTAPPARLVRRDLLEKLEKKPNPPERNIFRPDRRRPASGGKNSGPGGLPGGEEAAPSGAEDRDAPGGETLAAGFVPRLRYIGYIGSHARAVALVLLQDEAQALAVGDPFLDGWTILTITPRELEFVGPDDVSRRVSIEGEER